MEKNHKDYYWDFKYYALEKIDECAKLMATQPLTYCLAKNIFEVASNLNDTLQTEGNRWKKEIPAELLDVPDIVANFYQHSSRLFNAVENMENFLYDD